MFKCFCNWLHEFKLKRGWIKPNLMYIRLKRLYEFINACSTEELENLDKINLSHQRCYLEDKEIKLKFLNKEKFYFQSDLGTVQIVIKYVYPRAYKIEYSNYAGTKIFIIYANEERIDADFEGDIKAKDADLAIFELEEYFRNSLGTIDEIIEKRKTIRHSGKVESLV